LRKFKTRFLEGARQYLASLDPKSAAKLLYVIDNAEQTNDPKLFKKLNGEIWEFRSKYLGKQNRLLAFWDKTGKQETLVIATNGFVKKSQKTPAKEIKRAEKLREQYFDNKSNK